jgi:uncharacterized membrane protein YbhN (UPF0104 family)
MTSLPLIHRPARAVRTAGTDSANESMTTSSKNLEVETRGIRRRIATAGLLAVLATSLLLAVPPLRGVLDEVIHISPGWIAAAVGLEVVSCLGFVVIFRLFFETLPARQARRVAWTEMASGALLPGGGVGGLAIGGWLMHLAGVPTKRIVQRSSGLFFLTSGVNVAVVALAGLVLLVGIVPGPHDVLRTALPIAAAVGAAAAVLALPRVVSSRRRWAGRLVAGIRDAESALRQPSWRLAGAVAFLLCDIAVLWVTFTAVGGAPPVAALVLAYMLGYLANIIPVPGGIGVLDSGLAGMLVAYGAPATHAAAAVLVYHAIAFWVPGLGGLGAYALLRRQLLAPAARPAPAPCEERRRVRSSGVALPQGAVADPCA